MRQPRLVTPTDAVEPDQPAEGGVFKRRRSGNVRQRRKLEWFADGKRVNHFTHRGGQGTDPRLDQFSQLRRDDGITRPSPIAMVARQPAVVDLLFDDVLQVQGVAIGQLPQPAGGLGVEWTAQGFRKQRRGLVARQWVQVDPLELVIPPNLLCFSRSRFTVAGGENNFCNTALHDLVYNEC